MKQLGLAKDVLDEAKRLGLNLEKLGKSAKGQKSEIRCAILILFACRNMNQPLHYDNLATIANCSINELHKCEKKLSPDLPGVIRYTTAEKYAEFACKRFKIPE